MPEAVILSACRTAIGKFGKSLVGIPAPRLGAIAIGESVRRAKVQSKQVEEVIMGNVVSAGLGQNPARQSAIFAGIPVSVGAFTVNKVCGSGLKGVMLAAQSIKAGDNNLVVAGGMENMSNAPYLVRNLRWGVRYGDTKMVDSMINDGLWDVYNDYHMGITGEVIAKRYRITRRDADEFAYESHMRASRAIREGRFDEEIVPVEVEGEKGAPEHFKKDECVREDTTLEKLRRLKPVFKDGGILTAGNSSQLSDGASALVVASEEKAEKLGLRPLAKIIGYATGGTKPELVMEAPIPTTKALLSKVGMGIEEMDLVEHNEAYATASIAVREALGVDPKKFNVNGGAVSLGHPIGCSGARVLTTLIYALKHTGKKRGLATLCLGGGNAVSMIVER
ncbi:MAG: acetyl-CoA C-acetyltransferase [Thaumarchaeota archaeon]|nr:MAG: acetyl-CoA C-acetyltransferase [Nitrososphaerota archaeon]